MAEEEKGKDKLRLRASQKMKELMTRYYLAAKMAEGRKIERISLRLPGRSGLIERQLRLGEHGGLENAKVHSPLKN